MTVTGPMATGRENAENKERRGGESPGTGFRRMGSHFAVDQEPVRRGRVPSRTGRRAMIKEKRSPCSELEVVGILT